MTLLSIIPEKLWRKRKTRKKRKYKCKTIREALYPANNRHKKTNATVEWVKINSQKEAAMKNRGLSEKRLRGVIFANFAKFGPFLEI